MDNFHSPSRKLPPGVDNVCKVVSHKINFDGTQMMSAFLIHCLPLKMSAIQLFLHDKMAVVAHIVGQETIGDEKMLRLFDLQDLPWRAMIIKGIYDRLAQVILPDSYLSDYNAAFPNIMTLSIHLIL